METLAEKVLGVLVLVLLLVFVMNIYKQNPYISGVVTSAGTGEPLEGVLIRIGDQSAKTDTYGSFVLILKQEGRYTLSTELKGYAPYSQDFVVKTGSPTTFNITLEPALAGLATARGTVRDATTHQPIAGAHIAIAGLETDTDNYGNFEVTQLPLGEHQLSITRKDYRSYRHDFLIGESARMIFDIVLFPEFSATSTVNEEASEIPEPEDSEIRGWTMFKGDPTHCGIVDGNYQGKRLSLAWATRLGYAHTYYNSQPVCNTKSVFVAAHGYVDSPYFGADNNALYALEMEDGSQRWRVVMADEIVSIALAGSTLLASCRDGFLYAYDASSGQLEWQVQVMPSVFSEITVQGNTDVFVSSSDGAVLRIRAGNGEIVWKRQVTDGTPLTSAPTVIHDAVYVSDFDGEVYKLRLSDGNQVWETRLPGWTRGSLVVEDSVLFCGTRAGEWKDGSGKLFALRVEDGAVLWSRATSSEIWSSISVGDGVVYFGADKLYAANVSTGNILWEAPIACWRQPPVITGDSVMVVDLDNQRLVGLEKATGDIIFEFGGTFRGDNSQVPLVVGDRVYIGLMSGYVVGLNFIQGSQADKYTTPDIAAERAGASFILQPGEEIQSIVDIAPEGATITLSPGEYTGPISIRRSIDLVGSGSTDEVIITGGHAGQPVIEIGKLGQVPKVLIRNMTIQNESKNACCGLRVQGDSTASVDDICFQIDGAAGILALDSTHLTITNSEISDCSTIGILADLKARVHLIATTVSGTDGTGVMCRSRASILMEDANVVDSHGVGVVVSARGNVQLNRVSIVHNTRGGISLWNWSEAHIASSQIVENGGDGIVLRSSADLELEGCSGMRNSGFGILVCMQSCPPTAFPDSYCQETEFSGSVKGTGNNISPIGEDDGNGLGALCPQLSASLWPDKFIESTSQEIPLAEPIPEPILGLDQLTRGKVAEFLSQHPLSSKVWSPIYIRFGIEDESKIRAPFEELKRQGYINDYVHADLPFGRKLGITSSTRKGNNYLRDYSGKELSGQDEWVSVDGITVATHERVDIQVTGIRTEGSYAFVDYTWRYGQTTPVFDILRPILAVDTTEDFSASKKHDEEAYFALYDDGWRLANMWGESY